MNVHDDSDANKADTSDFSIMVDNTAPTTTASAGSYTFNTWTNQDVTISLSCDDGSGSGCDKTYYCTDTSNSCTPTTEYSSSFTITAEGTTYVRFYSKDRAGNNESVDYKIVKIDKTPPTTTDDAPSGWQASDVTITLTPSDSGSGVHDTNYCIDTDNTCTPNISGTSVDVTCSAGSTCQKYVRYRSIDNAGNVEAINSVLVQIDKEAPSVGTTTLSGFSTYGSYIKGTGTIVGGTATDSGSGIDTTTCEYTADNGTTWNAGTWNTDHCEKTDFTISDGVTYTFNTRVKDNVANLGTGTATSSYTGDLTPPTTTHNAPSTWQGDDVTVTLSCSDSGSGCANTYYCIDDSNTCTPTTTGTSVNVTCASGSVCQKYVRFYSEDNLSNAETTTATNLIKIDKQAPTTTDDAPSGWQTAPFSFTLTPSDGSGSGVSSTAFRIDGGDWNANTTVWITTDGNHQVDYNSTDNVGNVENTHTIWVALDTVAPTTTDDHNAGWQKIDQNVHLTCSDTTSGCDIIQYRIDGGSWQTYNPATGILFTTDGNFQLDYNAKDVAGNIETTKTVWITVDKTAPTTSHDAPSGWQNTDINIHLTCSDATSGCNITQYRIDSGAWTTYDTNILISTDGNHQIDFNSTDIAGNVETTNTIWVARDTVKPTIIDFNIHEDKIGTNEAKPDLNITATDDRSGMYQMRFSCDNSNWTSWINYANQYSDFNFLDPTYGCTASEGIKTVYIQVSDKAGNYSLTTSDDINYDVTPPTIDNNRLSATEIQTGESVTIYVDVSDNLTGVNTVKYYILYPTGDTYIWSMDLNDGNTYVATFGDTSVSGYYQIYKFEAMDNVNTGNIGTLDTVLKFNVVEPGTGGEGGGGEAGGGGGSGGTVLFKEIAVADLNFKPSAIDHYFIYNCVIPFFCKLDLTKADKKQLYTAVILSSKELKKCESGKPNFTCELKDSSTAVIKLEYQANNKLSEILETRIALTDTDDQINYVPVRVRVINLGFYIPLRTPIQLPDSLKGILSDPAWFALDEQGRIIGIRVWWMPIILIVIVLLVWKLKK